MNRYFIGRGIKVAAERQLLVDGLDSVVTGIVGIGDFHLLSPYENSSGVRLFGSSQNLDQRGLAGAVMAKDAHHFAHAKLDIHVLQCSKSAEALADPLHPDQGRIVNHAGLTYRDRIGRRL